MSARELGPLTERTKTTMWVDRDLLSAVKGISEKLGVSQTAFFTLAVAHYAVGLSQFVGPGVKRKDALKKMQEAFLGVVERAAEGL